MKRLMMLVILVGLVLSGCASTTSTKWCKPGATKDSFIRDRRDCQEKTATSGTGMTHERKDYWINCMKIEKGWSECTK